MDVHPDRRLTGIAPALGLAMLGLGACSPPPLADLVIGLTPAGTRVPFAPRLFVEVCVPVIRAPSFYGGRELDCDLGGQVRVGDSAGVADASGFEVDTAELDLDTLEPLTVEVTLNDETGTVVVDAPFGPRTLIGPSGPLQTGSEVAFVWSHERDTLGARDTQRLPGKGIETTIHWSNGAAGAWPVRVAGQDIVVTVPTTEEVADSCPDLAECTFHIDIPFQVQIEACDFGQCAMEELYRTFVFTLVDAVDAG